jgi:hypothetical protein
VTGSDVDPAVRELSGRLLPESDELAPLMAARIRAGIPLYRDGRTVPVAALDASCSDNLRYVLGNLAGTPVVDREEPRATGVARAEAGVPYAAVLQAYRVGGRFIWELLVERADATARDTLLRAAADIWAVTDDLSAQVTDAYRTTFADRARRDAQVRSALLGAVLDGDLAATEQVWESASVLHMPRDGEFVIVTAESVSPGTEALPDIEDRLHRLDVASVWRLDVDHQDGLIVLRSRFRFDDLVSHVAPMTSGRTGVSRVFTTIDDAPRALREARLACAAATPGVAELVCFDERPTATLLATTPDSSDALAQRILGPVLELPREDRTLLLRTVRVWFAADGSTSSAAEQLHLHRNTVRYRLRRLEELTGRSLARPIDIAEIHLALEAVRISAANEREPAIAAR